MAKYRETKILPRVKRLWAAGEHFKLENLLGGIVKRAAMLRGAPKGLLECEYLYRVGIEVPTDYDETGDGWREYLRLAYMRG